MAKGLTGKIGAWAFLIGVVLALIIGLFSNLLANYEGIILAILIIVGIIIGLLNISGRESSHFLLATIALVIVSAMGQSAIPSTGIGGILNSILNSLLILFVPTTIVVALKSVFGIARN